MSKRARRCLDESRGRLCPAFGDRQATGVGGDRVLGADGRPDEPMQPSSCKEGQNTSERRRWGTVCLHVEGKPAAAPACRPPAGRESAYTVWQEIALNPGDQYTISPNTRHWFQAGDEGAVVSEFSTRSTDENDIFTDPESQRITKIL